MQGVQSELLAVLQAKACVAAAPCKWAAGEGMKELLAQAKKGADKEAATLMDSAAFISGPLLSWEQQLESVIDQTRCALPLCLQAADVLWLLPVLLACMLLPARVRCGSWWQPAEGCCDVGKSLHAVLPCVKQLSLPP